MSGLTVKNVSALFAGRDDLVRVSLASDAGGNLSMSPGEQSPSLVLDGDGLVAVPGLFDVHVHGIDGHRFYDFATSDEAIASLKGLATALPRHGVTSFLATTMTESPKSVALACAAASSRVRSGAATGSLLRGVHLEGPFLSRRASGAHRPDFIEVVSAESLEKLLTCSHGMAKVVTADPESDPASLLPEWARANNITLSIGHTPALGSEVVDYVRSGYRRATHLFNAMPTLHHRSDSLAIATLMNEEVFIELIADGRMVDERWLRLAIRLAGWKRIVAVSDAIHLTGSSAEDAKGMFCGTPLMLSDGAWRRTKDLAVWAPDSGLASVIPRLLALADGSWRAVADATAISPALSVGLSPRDLSEGAPFDAAVFDVRGRLEATVVNGELAYIADHDRIRIYP